MLLPSKYPNNSSFLLDEIYNEKHSIISNKIYEWNKHSVEKFINIQYKDKINSIYQQIIKNKTLFEQRIVEILKTVNAEFQLLNKIKNGFINISHHSQKDDLNKTQKIS
jgi:hypothetical protein